LRDIAAQPGFQKYLFNTGWMFADKILRLISGLFIGAYVARYLGPGPYGLINYALSFVSLFAVIATLGLDTLVVRELFRRENDRDKILGTAFVLRMTAAALMFLLIVAVVSLFEPDPTTRYLIYIIGTGTFFETFGIIEYFFQARVLSKYGVWSQMIALVAISMLRVILVLNESPLIWFACSYVLDFFVLALGLMFFYSRSHASLRKWIFDGQTARQLMKDCWPLIFASLAVVVYSRMGQLMIKWMLGNEALGHYGVASRLSDMWNFIPVTICASVFPAILNAKQKGETLYLTRMQQLYDVMVLISLGVAIPMTFFSGFIVQLLFGAAFAPAADILVLYIWSSVFIFLGVANGKWIISENLQLFRMTMLLLGGLLNIGLNYVLIRQMGLNGAAVAGLASYAFTGYFCFLLTAKTRPVFWSMTRSFNPFHILNHNRQ
jgi:O-antigen/teichoic acid export membrane protein